MTGDFEYVKVHSIEEGCRLLDEASGSAAVLAGGTDLLVEIRNGLKSPTLLIDCKELEPLHVMRVGGDSAQIGAGVPLNRLIEHRDVRSAYPALASALTSIGTYQLRNRATMGGNLCNASPAADSAPVLLVLGARLEIAGAHGSRSIPLDEFFLGVKRTALRADELVTSVTVPRRPDIRVAFRKQQRIRGHDLAVVNAAGAYDPAKGTIAVAIGSCAPIPTLFDPLPFDPQPAKRETSIRRIVEAAMEAVSPISDVRASAGYRRAVLPVLLRRVLADCAGDGGNA